MRLLWAVASILIFGKAFMKTIMICLPPVFDIGCKGVLGNDMVARAMTQLDRVDGDIDTLMTRLHISGLGPTSRTVLTGQTAPSSGRIVHGN